MSHFTSHTAVPETVLANEDLLSTRRSPNGSRPAPPAVLSARDWELVQQKTGLTEQDTWNQFCNWSEENLPSRPVTAGEYLTHVRKRTFEKQLDPDGRVFSPAFPVRHEQTMTATGFVPTRVNEPAYAQPRTQTGFSTSPAARFRHFNELYDWEPTQDSADRRGKRQSEGDTSGNFPQAKTEHRS